MKVYASSIIPRIRAFSQRLDDFAILTSHHWLVINEDESRSLYIFRKNKELIISNNGIVEYSAWDYLGHNKLIIKRNNTNYLFWHEFVDDHILVLRIYGRNEYAILFNDSLYNGQLDPYGYAIQYLNTHYTLSLPTASQLAYTANVVDTKQSIKMGKYRIVEVHFATGTICRFKHYITEGKFTFDDIRYFYTQEECVQELYSALHGNRP